MFQPLQGLWDGSPLGGDVLAEWRRLATVFPDLPVSFSGWTGAEFSEPSRPGAIPQHLWPAPPDQSASCHPAAPDCQFRQRGQLAEVLLPKFVCAKFAAQCKGASCGVCVCVLSQQSLCFTSNPQQFSVCLCASAGSAGSEVKLWTPKPWPHRLDVSQSHEMDQRHRPQGRFWLSQRPNW